MELVRELFTDPVFWQWFGISMFVGIVLTILRRKRHEDDGKWGR